jgi:hypothetical protein
MIIYCMADLTIMRIMNWMIVLFMRGIMAIRMV